MTTNHYFWTWFIDNQKNLKNLHSIPKKLQKHFTFWLNWHLHYYSKGVDCILVFPKQERKKMQLILTANGKQEYFEKVELLVKEAPKIKGWKFTAFVQPQADIDAMVDGRDEPYVFKDISLKASEVQIEPIEYVDTQKIDMIVYLKYYTIQADYKDLMQIVYFMVEDVLGEKFLHENISFVELAQLPKEADDQLLHLYDLQLYIDDINLNRKKDCY